MGLYATLLTLNAPEGESLSLLTAARLLELDISRLDAEFGVQLIDPKNHVYCVRAYFDEGDRDRGFSDPEISL